MKGMFRSSAVSSRSVAAVLAATAGAVVALAGCAAPSGGSPPPTPPPVLLTAAEARAEYLEQTGRLTLPAGQEWPASPSSLRADAAPPGQMFEAGVGEQEAQFYWYCSWATVALGDAQERSWAMDMLDSFEALSVWQRMDSNGHALFRGIQESAVSADMEPLAAYVADNCAV